MSVRRCLCFVVLPPVYLLCVFLWLDAMCVCVCVVVAAVRATTANSIGAAGATALADSLKTNSTLQTLNLECAFVFAVSLYCVVLIAADACLIVRSD